MAARVLATELNQRYQVKQNRAVLPMAPMVMKNLNLWFLNPTRPYPIPAVKTAYQTGGAERNSTWGVMVLKKRVLFRGSRKNPRRLKKIFHTAAARRGIKYFEPACGIFIGRNPGQLPSGQR